MSASAKLKSHPSGSLIDKIMDSTDLGVVLATDQGVIIGANSRLETYTGWSLEELKGKTPSVFKSGQTPEEDYRRLWSRLLNGEVWDGTFVNKAKDGRLKYVKESIFPVRDYLPHVAFVAIHRDKTETEELKRQLDGMTEGARLQYDVLMSTTEKYRAALDQRATDRRAAATAMVVALEARDRNTVGHAWRTWRYARVLADRLGLLPDEVRWSFKAGCLLHDVGKIGIPDAVLLKPGALDPSEFALMKTHPVTGFNILQGVLDDPLSLSLVRSHHERLDGSGYPDGLAGSMISPLVRVLSVCDCFDALTSDRSYRKALAPEQAVAVILRDALVGRLDRGVARMLSASWREGALVDILRSPPPDVLQL